MKTVEHFCKFLARWVLNLILSNGAAASISVHNSLFSLCFSCTFSLRVSQFLSWSLFCPSNFYWVFFYGWLINDQLSPAATYHCIDISEPAVGGYQDNICCSCIANLRANTAVGAQCRRGRVKLLASFLRKITALMPGVTKCPVKSTYIILDCLFGLH